MQTRALHRRRRPATYAVCLAALLTLGLLAGCGGGASDHGAVRGAASLATSRATTTAEGAVATTSPTPTTAPTLTSHAPAPSADPVLARIPPAARPETERAAQRFARYFFESLNAAAVSADPALVEGLFGAECKTCVAMQRSVRDLQASGEHHEKPTIEVVSVTTDSFVRERRVVLVAVNQSSVGVVDGRGKIASHTLAARGAFALTLRYGHSHWVVTRLQTVAR